MDRKIKGDKRFPAAIDDKPKKKIAKKKTKLRVVRRIGQSLASQAAKAGQI